MKRCLLVMLLALAELVAVPGVRAAALEAGMLLVARDEMPDVRFREAVVLIVQGGARGTAGLVLNRPSRLVLAEAVPALAELAGSDRVLSYGGPVAPQSLMALVKAVDAPPEPAQQVFARIYLTGPESLAGWLSGREVPPDYRVFAGYAGWAPGQLDRELAQGDWLVLAADEDALFADDEAGLWPMLRAGEAGAKPRD